MPRLRLGTQSWRLCRHTAGLKPIDWFRANDRQWVLKQLHFHQAPHKVGQEYQLWQEGYHPELMQGEAMLHAKLEYIHNNPVKRGYVDDPAHWRYSSCRNY